MVVQFLVDGEYDVLELALFVLVAGHGDKGLVFLAFEDGHVLDDEAVIHDDLAKGQFLRAGFGFFEFDFRDFHETLLGLSELIKQPTYWAVYFIPLFGLLRLPWPYGHGFSDKGSAPVGGQWHLLRF